MKIELDDAQIDELTKQGWQEVKEWYEGYKKQMKKQEVSNNGRSTSYQDKMPVVS